MRDVYWFLGGFWVAICGVILLGSPLCSISVPVVVLFAWSVVGAVSYMGRAFFYIKRKKNG